MILTEKVIIFKANEYDDKEVLEFIKQENNNGWRHIWTNIKCQNENVDDYPLEIEVAFILNN